ncbi:unnamed protein product [Aspergillus oryzae RIB40]|uniref:DNA, SC005 n=1 Tax=Aspergillus oryzae (strain ATCC 42149 / RIB 40) TaxID=510516 RepID=Q2URA7_ASPOR|nr:unnamed protein product [Aspergillus oryzae RIB40]BAE55908.1 unnamed protein product [Aspergillus oryzae RIB40]
MIRYGPGDQGPASSSSVAPTPPATQAHISSSHTKATNPYVTSRATTKQPPHPQTPITNPRQQQRNIQHQRSQISIHLLFALTTPTDHPDYNHPWVHNTVNRKETKNSPRRNPSSTTPSPSAPAMTPPTPPTSSCWKTTSSPSATGSQLPPKPSTASRNGSVAAS